MPGSFSTPRSTTDVCIRTRPSRTWPKFSHRPQDHQLQGAHLMSAYGHGRHEHGQNFLTDHKIINSIIDLVKQTSGPIIEIGPGSRALTHPLPYLGRAITAVEVAEKLSPNLTQQTSWAADEVVHDDFLTFLFPATPCVIVGNIPFHLTTAIL